MRPSRSAGSNGACHAGDADGVDVAAEHQRAARRAALERADDVGPAGRDFLHLDGQADGAQLLGDPAATAASPAAPGTSDGLTESMATSSLSSRTVGSMRISRFANSRTDR